MTCKMIISSHMDKLIYKFLNMHTMSMPSHRKKQSLSITIISHAAGHTQHRRHMKARQTEPDPIIPTNWQTSTWFKQRCALRSPYKLTTEHMVQMIRNRPYTHIVGSRKVPEADCKRVNQQEVSHCTAQQQQLPA